MTTRFYLLFLLFSTVAIQAQDLHFSQFNEQPALINPALTGATAPSRASIAYRNQWRSVTSPYITSGVSADTRFNASSWQQVDKFRSMTFKERSAGRIAGGIAVYNDNAGDGSMKRTQGSLSLATFVQTGKKSLFSVGLQASVVQLRINQNDFVFPNQYNGTGYDANMSSGEVFQRANYTYGDFAAGILWSYGQNDRSLLGKKQLKGNLGVSVYNLNRSRYSFISPTKVKSFSKYVAHGDLLASLSNEDYAIAPSFLFQVMGPSNELTVGTMIKRFIDIDSKYTGIMKRSSLGLGFYFRNKDAAILAASLDIKEQLVIGISYDVNVSRLKASTNSRGGFELTMRYTPPKSFLYQEKK